ncbi:unnamed protein product [Microthlaspi erraticum]|uniref:Serine aminopeptidase S33 domain-containing protein n=1 Tax=Microthlaspi erraticum TaxID=1685480 RepID=A0A6D2KFZ6_9BRAS|nr:unnamed protein product [Microthlaspi erraticum]
MNSSKIVIPNNHGEKLVGVLHETGSREVVVMCHGCRSNKNTPVIEKLASAIEKEGISAFRFDFSGNGESDGTFNYGNYKQEADGDLRSVIQYFHNTNRVVPIILGHSKGGNAVLRYASMFHDSIRGVINLSGCYDLERCHHLDDPEFVEKLKRQGFVNVKVKNSSRKYRITQESLDERFSIDMNQTCLRISKGCKVLTVHGSDDDAVPVEEAKEFAKIIPNHKLEILQGADHSFSQHRSLLASTVIEFIKSIHILTFSYFPVCSDPIPRREIRRCTILLGIIFDSDRLSCNMNRMIVGASNGGLILELLKE